MAERIIDVSDFKLPKPRNVGLLILLIIIFIVVWSTFVIVPAATGGLYSGGGV